MKIELAADKPTVGRIIEAAIPLFAIKGVAAVSVKEIAEAAGVNIALISYYFGGKENLYMFILEKQMAILSGEIEIIRQKPINPVDKIRNFVDCIIGIHKNNPYLDRLFYNEVINPTKCFDVIVTVEVSRLQNFLKECIQRAVELGQFCNDLDVNCATLALLNIINCNFINKSLSDGLLPDREDQVEYYIKQALEIYLKGVVTE